MPGKRRNTAAVTDGTQSSNPIAPGTVGAVDRDQRWVMNALQDFGTLNRDTSSSGHELMLLDSGLGSPTMHGDSGGLGLTDVGS